MYNMAFHLIGHIIKMGTKNNNSDSEWMTALFLFLATGVVGAGLVGLMGAANAAKAAAAPAFLAQSSRRTGGCGCGGHA